MNILLALTGSIAVSLAEKLVLELRKIGEVKVISTTSAQILLNDEIDSSDEFDYYLDHNKVEHIELRKWADVLVVAPATYNTINKFACGIADNIVTNVFACWDFNKPIYICPSMNTLMWQNPILQENIQKLKNLKTNHGIVFIDPVHKTLACGDTGIGGLANIEDIVNAVRPNHFRGIPKLTHPGSFGYPRKYDVHTGIDLYVPHTKLITAFEDGVVVDIGPFTGPQINMDWWNDTEYIVIKGESGYILYGEILPANLTVKDEVRKGDIIGRIIPVLPENKIRHDIPNHSNFMLHLELYSNYLHPACWRLKAKIPWGLTSPSVLMDKFFPSLNKNE